MGKRKKNAKNVVKVDLGDLTIKNSRALPVLVQNLSRDGRRIEQTVHKIPIPRLNPPPLAFDPCPVVAEDEDDTFFDVQHLGEEDEGGEDGDCVCSYFSPLFGVSDGCGGYSWIHCGCGAWTAMFFWRNLSCGKGAWDSPKEGVTLVRTLVRLLPRTCRVGLTTL